MNTGPKRGHLALVDAAAKVKPTASSCMQRTCNGRTKRGGECRVLAGQGTTHPGVGQCWHHDGQVEEGSPCPLPLTALELRLWDVITAELRALRLDQSAFWSHKFGLVVALSGLHSARASAAGAAATVKGENGAPKKHPSSTVVNQMLAHIRTYSNDLGLNPSALASMDLPDPGTPPTRMEGYIKGRR